MYVSAHMQRVGSGISCSHTSQQLKLASVKAAQVHWQLPHLASKQEGTDIIRQFMSAGVPQ